MDDGIGREALAELNSFFAAGDTLALRRALARFDDMESQIEESSPEDRSPLLLAHAIALVQGFRAFGSSDMARDAIAALQRAAGEASTEERPAILALLIRVTEDVAVEAGFFEVIDEVLESAADVGQRAPSHLTDEAWETLRSKVHLRLIACDAFKDEGHLVRAINEVREALSIAALSPEPQRDPEEADLEFRLGRLYIDVWKHYSQADADLGQGLNCMSAAFGRIPRGHPAQETWFWELLSLVSDLGIQRVHGHGTLLTDLVHSVDIIGDRKAKIASVQKLLTLLVHAELAGTAVWMEVRGLYEMLLEMSTDPDDQIAGLFFAAHYHRLDGNALSSEKRGAEKTEALLISLSFAERIAYLLPESSLEPEFYLQEHALTHFELFKEGGGRQHLERAYELARSCVYDFGDAPADNWSNYGVIARRRAIIDKDPHGLAEAVSAQQQCMHLTDDTDPNYPEFALAAMWALASLAEYTNSFDDVLEAIRAAARAANIPGERTQVEGNALLGSFLLRRFQEKGSVDDLLSAERCLAAAQEASWGEWQTVANLAICHRLLSKYFGEREFLIKALDAMGRAIEMSPSHEVSLDLRLGEAEIALDLIGAGETSLIGSVSDALVELEASPSQDGRRLVAKARLLTFQAKATGDAGYFDAAIAELEEAVNSPNASSSVMSQLVGMLDSRGDFSSADSGRRSKAIALLSRLVEDEASDVNIRIWAAERLGFQLARDGAWAASCEVYSTAVRLLPRTAWIGLDYFTRAMKLNAAPGMGSLAATAAIMAGEPLRAVSILEQARGLLWRQAEDPREELAELRRSHPGLAEQLDDAYSGMGSSFRMPSQPILYSVDREVSDVDWSGERQIAARRWEALIAEVRRLPGYQYFLEQRPVESFVSQLPHPVVLINVSRIGSHAIIIGNSGVLSVCPLERLSVAEAIERAEVWSNLVDDRSSSASDQAMIDILGWLWDVLARPVLDLLGWSAEAAGFDGDRRLYICPTSVIALLPVHAAGRYGSGELGHSFAEACTVSYIFSLGSLWASLAAESGRRIHQLTIAVSNVRGAHSLPGVLREIETIDSFIGAESRLVLRDAEAGREAVIGALPTHNWVHFSCHASFYPDRPEDSAFLLWDGPLRLLDLVSAIRRSVSEVAVLSACDTGRTSTYHLDEGINLASALQFAGFRQVVATSWRVRDGAAAEFSGRFYEAVAESQNAPDSVPRAVRMANSLLRTKYPTRARDWAAFAHYGV